MSNDIVVRILLLPLALLYGLGVGLRNLFYRMGILRSVRFGLPVVSVGNLSVGGAGKTPHIEYLIRWLDQYLQVAVLSRGYGRKTQGFRPVTIIDTAELVGDEPLQFKRKFSGVPIAVSESRALGVPELVKRNPDTQVVLLDDAFQHLAVSPAINLLLTEHDRPFTRDWLLPAGRLREWRMPTHQESFDRAAKACERNPSPAGGASLVLVCISSVSALPVSDSENLIVLDHLSLASQRLLHLYLLHLY